jgi:hypothetical protein
MGLTSFEMEFSRSVTIAPYISTDVYGKETYGTPRTVEACVDYIIKNIKDFRGNEFITSSWIALPHDTSLSWRDKITLPNGATEYIGRIGEGFDEEAKETVYIEVYTGRVKPGEGIL